MRNRIPSVKLVMTPFPYSIEAEESANLALGMMEQHRIRHLPVTRDGRLAGVVSDRDIHIARSLMRTSSGRFDVPVWSVCTRDPYVVDIDTRIDEVADEMANRHIGSAIVVKKDKLAGIITTTDICRAYAETLRLHLAPDSGDDDVA